MHYHICKPTGGKIKNMCLKLNSANQPQTTAKTTAKTSAIPTNDSDLSSFIISELKLLNTNTAYLLANQKLIIKHQSELANQLQIDLKEKRPAIGTSRRFQKKAYQTLASFLGIVMVQGFIGIIIAIHAHYMNLTKSS